jgi:ubiquitin-conjugating enzyme E2 H
MYPNPTDPLNGDAASLFLHKPDDYKTRVHEYVRKYATDAALKNDGYGDEDADDDDESTISDISYDENDEIEDMEM